MLCGVVLILYLTGTSLNIESFMGSIMCIGISVSNSVMLVTFTARDWHRGHVARSSGARCHGAVAADSDDRLRQVVGMMPMSLELQAGSQMEGPLGRAVIGGLTMSTLATLLIVPSIFADRDRRSQPRSPSLYAGRLQKPYYHPASLDTLEVSGNPEPPAAANQPIPARVRTIARENRDAQAVFFDDGFPPARTLGEVDGPCADRAGGVCPSSGAIPGAVRHSGRPLHPARAADDRSRRQAAQLCRKLRTLKRLSKDDRLHRKWNVDIGDRVKKGEVLAKLFVPELVENWHTKQNDVVLDQRKISLRQQVVEVAKAKIAEPPRGGRNTGASG